MPAAAIDLSATPEAQREAVAAVLRERDALKEANKRLEHLVAELNHAVHGKRSEKLSEDGRQLAFEDLEIAVAEAEEKQETPAPSESRPRRASRRNRGNLPKDLPRIERVIEPDSLLCPCGRGVAIVARTNGATMATAQARRRAAGTPAACRRHACGVTIAPSGWTSCPPRCG
ncbi:hypothetical protein GCM10008024_27610 [Allgaiera indica]|uniref:Transposase C of IS166 homeodomain-containing protein n=1 Tax=Allgaiera indica TaxID=765699 RepID=A0AAN4USR0_9RHOB|nr:transposase [Allgaiera indica]GHE03601.1 hypothetical protein GCM10008024_27610 [Allgaiera indica]SDX44765.1 Transposase C of IS166 homeodomain-containing protein [Allgaiera indica]